MHARHAKLTDHINRPDLQCAVAGVAGTYPNSLFYIGNKNLAVTHFTGSRSTNDRLDGSLGKLITHGYLDFRFRQEVDNVLGAAIQLGMPALAAKAFDFCHGHAVNADFAQSIAHIVKPKWFYDCCNQLHSGVPRWIIRRSDTSLCGARGRYSSLIYGPVLCNTEARLMNRAALRKITTLKALGQPMVKIRMGKNSYELLSATDPRWVKNVLQDFDSFLIDHASCERKANALLMSMIVKYPDRPTIIPRLIELAQEELEHFAEAYAFMERRGLVFSKDKPDAYVNQLLAAARHGRDERFIDRMLISSVIEKRGAERFRIVAENIDDPELAAFYDKLWKSEVKHAHVFVLMLQEEYPPEMFDARLDELLQLEAEIIAGLELGPALH
jgi:tRNA-(ms[2]io[6]A)-hydroxylase